MLQYVTLYSGCTCIVSQSFGMCMQNLKDLHNEITSSKPTQTLNPTALELIKLHIYIYIYIYMCVCVYIEVFIVRNLRNRFYRVRVNLKVLMSLYLEFPFRDISDKLPLMELRTAV